MDIIQQTNVADIKELKAQVYDLNILLAGKRSEIDNIMDQIGKLNNIILQLQANNHDTIGAKE